MTAKSPWPEELLRWFCTRKVAHPNRKAAAEAAARVTTEVLHPYRCPACKKWHIGHYISGWEQAEKIYGVAPPAKESLTRRTSRKKKHERLMVEQERVAKQRKAERLERHRLLMEEQEFYNRACQTWEGEGGLLSCHSNERYGFRV